MWMKDQTLCLRQHIAKKLSGRKLVAEETSQYLGDLQLIPGSIIHCPANHMTPDWSSDTL